MIQVIVGIILLVIGLFFFLRRGSGKSGNKLNLPERYSRFSAGLNSGIVGGMLLLGGLVFLASTSFALIGANKVGHLKRIYGFEDLPKGRIVATAGQKGPQARILGPGFHFIPFLNIMYDVEERPVITVPEGYYGRITALDGATMPEGMFIAPKFADDRLAEMLNATEFLEKGGLRGPQETVLKPGQYRLNQFLFDVAINDTTKATIIPAGHVGVVKSNVSTPGNLCIEEEVRVADDADLAGEALSVPLVPKGCVGIWKSPLLPGAYYLNRSAFEVTLVDTRVQTWEYKGGYTKRIIDLSIDQKGEIRQAQRTEPQPIPANAADRAVFVKIEGWDIPLELRALIQVSPDNAPVVVGSVGGLDEVEDRILTPAIRSIVRNVAGSTIRVPAVDEDGIAKSPVEFVNRRTSVLDLIENRGSLEDTIEAQIKVEGRKAGVDIREIRLAEPSIPPELLISRLRVQLAAQLSKAYIEETAAQQKRIETEQAKSTADEQPRLVAAQIAVEIANQVEKERAALGRAERQFLEELARGQLAQAEVLGQDRVAMLKGLELVLKTLENKPELVGLIERLVPQTLVTGEGGGLAGAAAILGSLAAPAKPGPAAAQ